MAFVPSKWKDGAAGGTPITAAELNRIEAAGAAKAAQGEQGPKGDKGDTGAPGTAGAKGDKGDQGEPGTNTAAGTRAQLDAGTDTTVRAFSAKDIAEYVAAQIAAIPAA